MKFIKKIIGVICLIISLFIGIIGIIGILDRKIDLETKIVIEIIISYLLLLFLILGIKLLFNPKFGESKKKSNINMKDNILNKKSLEDINTYIIEFPFFGFKVFYSEKGEEWKYYSGKEVYKWLSHALSAPLEKVSESDLLYDYIYQKHLSYSQGILKRFLGQ